MSLHPGISAVTERIAARSAAARSAYLERLETAAAVQPARGRLGCANLAHASAACGPADKLALQEGPQANLAIVSAYNDLLSAHQPLEAYPALLKTAAREAGAVAQFAGGVPAMCDGITQGRAGMELSLFSRDVVAMSTAIALSHDVFDGALLLGVCDKIVPGLIIGALSFGHLPAVLVPAGPMPSGLSNIEKSRIRQLHAEGRISRAEVLQAEARAYHAPGTCTFYGTANSNQVMAEALGLQLPGASFVHPGTPLRDALTHAAAQRVVAATALGSAYSPIGRVVDERAVVNAGVALLATGGSTNHTLHLVAIAAAAGLRMTWEDLDELSRVVPLLARVYPNGTADVNRFHEAGGTSLLFRELLDAGLMHPDVLTMAGPGMHRYAEEPYAGADGVVRWGRCREMSGDESVLRPAGRPFAADAGLRLLDGSLGRAIAKLSAVKPAHRRVQAPARVFDRQSDFLEAFEAGDLDGDVVVVVRFQGPRSNGMPELHKLMPALGVLQDRGNRVALVTDGRLSGASGKVPSAIHCTPEAADGGPLALLHDGDVVRVDPAAGVLDVLGVDLAARSPAAGPDRREAGMGCGRELFEPFRARVKPADAGGSLFASPPMTQVAATWA